jgi:hypothetical protein
MSFDITITSAKSREKAAATALEPSYGPAGHERTRRQPVAFTDRQVRIVDRFTRLVVPWQRRQSYREAVEARLSATVGDAAVTASCIRASESFIDKAVLAEHGLVILDGAGSIRLPHTNQHRAPGGSKAVNGTERKSTRSA